MSVARRILMLLLAAGSAVIVPRSSANTGGSPRNELVVRRPSTEAQTVNTAYALSDEQKAEANSQAPAQSVTNTRAPSQPSPASANSDPAATSQSNPIANSAGSDVNAGDNAALQGRIQNALHNEPTLSGSHLSVNVTDNAITLAGTVASGKDKETADRITESFDGNRKLRTS